MSAVHPFCRTNKLISITMKGHIQQHNKSSSHHPSQNSSSDTFDQQQKRSDTATTPTTYTVAATNETPIIGWSKMPYHTLKIDLHPGISQQSSNCSSITTAAGKYESSVSFLQHIEHISIKTKWKGKTRQSFTQASIISNFMHRGYNSEKLLRIFKTAADMASSPYLLAS